MLVCCASDVIDDYSCIMGSCELVDLRLFLVWCMWPLYAAIYWGRRLLNILIVNVGHVAK